MKMKSLLLLTVMSQCLMVCCHHYEYHLIDKKKTWTEAQRYCRDHYTDLATVFDMADATRLRELVNQTDAWIGLTSNPGRENKKWHWSLPGLPEVNFNDIKPHFHSGEPNDGGNIENCVEVADKKLNDNRCNIFFKSICLNETKQPIVIHEPMTWTQAQNHCREHHIDLAGGLHLLRDGNFLGLEDQFWLGLFRDTWTWSDENSSTFRHWDLGLMKDGVGKKECATVLTRSGKWGSDNCTRKKPFFCYDDKVVLIKDSLDWEAALDHCRQHHLDLVSITNPHQQRWVQARAKRASTTHVWLGLRYTCVLDLWFWVSDHLVCYKNWKPSDGVKDECYYAATMDGSGEWVKTADTDKYNFICSTKSAPKPNTPPSISHLKMN